MVADTEDLSRYRYYTGAPLRRLDPEEGCPVLFRDLGSVALARFLAGTLERLAGPLSPLLFMRTVDYQEPYVDYEDTGRLVFLRPRELVPWFSGVSHVYVARATRATANDAVGFAPPGVELGRVAALAQDLRDTATLREALGGRVHDEARCETLERLRRLNAELEATERLARPLRLAFQSRAPKQRELARGEMARLGISEADLCSAWHHLPRARRAAFEAALGELDPRLFEAGR